MYRSVLPAVAGSVLFGCAVASYAADSNGMPTKAQKNVSAPLTQSSSCSTFQEFLLTGCQLSWYGVRLYGTIDVGYGYQTHGAPWDPFFASGASYFLQKMNRSSMWTLAPNGLSQSNLGIQIKEPSKETWHEESGSHFAHAGSVLQVRSRYLEPKLCPRLALAFATTSIMDIARAHAGPCTADIKQFEQEVRRSGRNPNAGPMAPQTVGAQLGHQPTPTSVRQAEKHAQAAFASALMSAKRFDTRGDRAACMRALTRAKRLYSL
jgi:hypothetical protein